MLLMHTDNCDFNFLQPHDTQSIIHFAEENESYRRHTIGVRFVQELLHTACFCIHILFKDDVIINDCDLFL